MFTYTIIMDFEGVTGISQLVANTPEKAVELWALNPKPEMLRAVKFKYKKTAWANELLKKINTNTADMVAIDGLKSVWCETFLQNDQLVILTIIKTNCID